MFAPFLSRLSLDSNASIITLGVADLDRALAFYQDGLGLELTLRRGDLVVFDFGDLRFGLYPAPAGTSGHTPITLSHNVLDNAAVRHLVDQAERAGARILSAPHVAIWGGYSASFADPDGHLWEVACAANEEPDQEPDPS